MSSLPTSSDTTMLPRIFLPTAWKAWAILGPAAQVKLGSLLSQKSSKMMNFQWSKHVTAILFEGL